MYHKSRRKRHRFYPEFYDDDEIEKIKESEIKLELEPGHAPDAGRGGPIQREPPVNYNDLLYPSGITAVSVFKQLENMQRDYIEKKLAVSRVNNSSLNDITPDISGSDKNINRNEAANINEHNEIRIEIPDSMFTEEIIESEVIEAANTDAIETANMIGDAHPDIPDPADSVVLNTQEIDTGEVLGVGAGFARLPDIDTHDTDINDISEFSELAETEVIATMAVADDTEPAMGIEEMEPEAIETFEHISVPEPIRQAEIIQTAGMDGSEVHIPFDKAKAIEYAHRWALDRNPNFLDFDELGGDCTNYISQILLAGGGKMDHTPVLGWYYSSGSEKSPSWTGVEQLYNYLMKEKETGLIAREISAEEAEAGDIVQLSFNGRHFQHTPFIVEVSRKPGVPFSFDSIKICAHSFDSQNRALDTYQWRKIRFIRILGHK